jgi:hypothetical protein
MAHGKHLSDDDRRRIAVTITQGVNDGLLLSDMLRRYDLSQTVYRKWAEKFGIEVPKRRKKGS